MEQRDFIKEQIEQLGRVLGKALSDLFKLKSSGQVSSGISAINDQLKGELDLDLDELLKKDKQVLKQNLIDRNLTSDHLETLSKYLEEVGRHKKDEHPEGAHQYFKTALFLLDIADEISETLSFERMSRKTNIEKEL